ncbi:MAG: 1-(5-phosphoribosyl)-5-[(5-phosphoribosylamino)methylideneamino]imidazole-4-carboxamide isomerase [Deltaproteobacteria bacterium]|nr:1-(5-phosphoribosyl)-5-[(5-phosphoribosylamino)methylideneamino]imidazole-4-carboxamide isomerase [Deltaproteobacteria bacterium]
MNIIPAIDLKNGRCVRLLQGRMDSETVFSDDPVSMAEKWATLGAQLIHIVDLDGAVEKAPRNLGVIKNILSRVSIPIQLGGGIRTLDTVDRYVDLGVSRVIIGTEAIRNPKLIEEACRKYPDQIIVGIDARNGRVAIEGWTETTDVEAISLARTFEDSGVCAINFTDIHRDGMQTGPNIAETRRLAESISIPVVASGGIGSIQDVQNLLPLASVGVVGMITGRALYTGSLDLSEAIVLAKKYGVTAPKDRKLNNLNDIARL